MSETKELRGDTPAELVRALDALALADGMTRNAYVVRTLGAHVKLVLHKHSLLQSMLRGNPLLPEASAPTPNDYKDI